MPDLQTRFEAAARDVGTLSRRPDNNTLLRLYALYKQATVGDVRGSRPGITDFAGRAKHDAWERVKGTGTEEAMQRYVDLVDDLMAK